MKYIIKNSKQHIFDNRFYDTETETLLSPIKTQNYTVIQVADSHYNHGFSIGDHRQICDLELTFSHVNGLLCARNGFFERVDKNAVYLSFKEETHALKSRKSAYFQSLAINFNPGPCQTLLETIRRKGAEQRVFSVPHIFHSFTEIIGEFRFSRASFFESNLDCLITAALIKLIRLGEEYAPAEILTCDETLSEVKHYIDTHFLQIALLEELSAVFGYTYSHISKSFKKAHGIAPGAYLAQKKIDYACDLLKDGTNLEEIAEILGYSSAFNFSRAFKNVTGLSPAVWRKQRKESSVTPTT